MYDDHPLPEFLKMINEDLYYKNHINPFKGKLIFYGPKKPLNHYSYIKNQDQSIYQKLLKDVSLARDLSNDRKAIDTGMQRDRRPGGNSSQMSLKFETYIEAQQRYMERLLYYGFYVNNQITESL
jgi:hypothetical protein